MDQHDLDKEQEWQARRDELNRKVLDKVLLLVDIEIKELESAYEHHLKEMNADEMFAFAVAQRKVKDLRIRLSLIDIPS